MKSIFGKYGLVWITLAVVTVVSAYLFKNSAYENAWLFIFAVGIVLISFFEAFTKR